MRALPLLPEELAGAELLLEELDLAEEALANLVRLSRVAEEALRCEGGWGARVEVDGTELLITARGERWSVHAPAGSDVGDAMMAARRLHGRLGEAAEGWDLDR